MRKIIGCFCKNMANMSADIKANVLQVYFVVSDEFSWASESCLDIDVLSNKAQNTGRWATPLGCVVECRDFEILIFFRNGE
jgi:hypothetical protein